MCISHPLEARANLLSRPVALHFSARLIDDLIRGGGGDGGGGDGGGGADGR